MNDIAAAYTASGEQQLHCPLMTLPTEMRIMIYKFALQHILDDAYDKAPGQTRVLHGVKNSRGDSNRLPFYTGALALVHTNRTIRAESLDTLATHMGAHVDRLKAEFHNIDSNVTRAVERLDDPGLDLEAVQAVVKILAEERKRYDKFQNSALQAKYICLTVICTKGG